MGEGSIPHPDIEILVRYRDGDLLSTDRTATEAHLEKCATCRKDLNLLQAAMVEGRKEPKSGMTLALWDGIRSKVLDWEAKRTPELSPEAVRNRIASQIEPFLGGRAALKALEPFAPNNENVLSVVEPILTEFLGPSAAAALVDRVVDLAIVNI